MSHPVEEVIAAEREAERMLKKAEEKKTEIIAKAKHEALGLLAEQQRKIEAEQEALVKRKTEELERKKEKIRMEGQSKVSQIERSAQGNVAKAIELILDEFEKRLR